MFEKGPGDHRDAHAAGLVRGAQGTMLCFDIRGDALFNRKGCEFRGARSDPLGQLDLEAEDVGGSHEHGHATAGGLGCRPLERAFLHGAQRQPGRIDGQPASRDLGGAGHAYNEPIRHAYSVPNVLKIGRV